MHDVAIIGGGVVGCAVARRFALAGAKVVLIEKGTDILSGASKANSAILHTGFDAPPNSLERKLVQAGRAEYLAIHNSFNLPLVKTGALVCAWDDHQAGKLEQILRTGLDNGVAELALLSGAQARQKQPSLSPRLVAAVEVAEEHVIDPWSAPLAYITQAIKMGATVLRATEVLKGEFQGDAWQLETNKGTVNARSIINTAGLYGDDIDRRLGLPVEFQIKPRKGQFVVLDKAAARHVTTIILPVPTEITKGIVVCPTAFGNVIIGPSAEEQDDRVRATVDHDMLAALVRKGAEIVPALEAIPVTALYAGLRPATEQKAYRVFSRPEKRAITLGGIRSTGLSSALGLAQHALELHDAFERAAFSAPRTAPVFCMPNLAESHERDWQRPNHGEIVCHCELVTRREIEATFTSALPPGDFGGLRRRTRAGMGRCQGFYCNSKLAAMTKGILASDLAVNTQEKA
ncbi:FAD-dependent oxidoreductase [Herbaspirillum rubrisubalbicans]|uniref:FAD-dependent oxidoreductase n=1 Tax=Herbaspirillum rubrisubalbicans TaxID=80842 RepID=A0ABX9BYT3_9BURK|nr:NAD(P)/FAD-dependent oxidoreductase [Herbaspirillum rubrisubalbicans]RAM63169.1 FAD-dependent oxidoreductase [Herbaspirillum rubrisubalbicans]RAN44297.1 FAD-dependent oxidoreductase [Herbaspirillum rubrisubalbicans]